MIRLYSDKTYFDGQTDGMKQYVKTSRNGQRTFTYAANIHDARLHFRTK